MRKSFFQLTVGKKMFGAFLIVLLFMAGLGISSMTREAQMQEKTNEITDAWMAGVEIANNVNYLTEHILSLQYKIMTHPDAAKKAAYIKDADTTFLAIDSQLAEYSKSFVSGEDEANTKALIEKWNQYKEVYKRAMELGKQTDLVNGSAKQATEIVKVMDESQKAFDEMQKHLDIIVKINHDGAIESKKESGDIYKENMKSAIAVFAVAMVVGLSMAYIMNRFISKPVKQVSEVLQQVAKGDLTVPLLQVKQKDEIGALVKALNEMIEGLRLFVHRIQDVSSTVAASSQQLLASSEQNADATNQVAAAVQEMAAGSDNQMQSTVETSRAMEEMATGIQRIAETTSEVSELSRDSAEQAQMGNDSIERVIGKMNAISGSVGQAGTDIKLLEGHSENIGGILAMIGDIAAQTSLLALNAAIESARAGEHGRGFAVVANEVKKLAEQSAASVHSITDIVTQIQEDTSKAVQTMNQSLNEVKAGLEAVDEANGAFKQIVGTAQLVSEKVQEVAAAAQQMAAGSEEVLASVNEMSGIAKQSFESAQTVAGSTEEQLASVQEIASSAQSLSEVAQELNDYIGKFKA